MNTILVDMALAVRRRIHQDEPEYHGAQDLEARDFEERLLTAESEQDAVQLCRSWLRLYAPEARRV